MSGVNWDIPDLRKLLAGLTRTADLLVRSQRRIQNQSLRMGISWLIRIVLNIYITIA
jgi:hypothetical protein